MTLQIQPQEIKNRKEIGHLDDRPVYQLGLKGGLYIIATTKGAKIDILASAPHPVVAKHIAIKLHPRLIITELLKSEGVTEQHYERLVPYYIELTNRLNSAVNG